MTITMLFITLLLITTLMLLLPRGGYVETCERMTAKLPIGIFNGLKTYLDEMPDHDSDAAFWGASRGLRGCWERLRATGVFLRLCQVHIREGFVAKQDVAEVFQAGFVQLIYSAFAVPEAAMCRAWPGLPHASARIALQFSASVAAGTHTLIRHKDAPECVIKLGSVL